MDSWNDLGWKRRDNNKTNPSLAERPGEQHMDLVN